MAAGLDDDDRPLLAGPVRWAPGTVTIDVGDREVAVAGEDELLRGTLGACDGRAEVRAIAAAHGPEARELLDALHAQGAVLPAEDAWRVLHRQSSVGTAIGRPIAPAHLHVLQTTTYAPVPAAERRVALAPAPSQTAALAAGRASMTPATPPASVTFAALSTILQAAYGHGAGGGAVPSAGGLYPLVVHAVLRKPLPPLETGLWWHDPRGAALHRVGEPLHLEPLFVPEPSCAALLARGEAVVFLSADLARPTRKYGPRGYRYALVETGAALQGASLAAAELGVPVRAIGGIDDVAVHAALGLPDTAVAVLALLVGC